MLTLCTSQIALVFHLIRLRRLPLKLQSVLQEAQFVKVGVSVSKDLQDLALAYAAFGGTRLEARSTVDLDSVYR